MVYHIAKDLFNAESGRNVLATCRRCGNKGYAKDFRIDDELRIMVCNECFTRPKTAKLSSKTNKEVMEVKKPMIEQAPRTMVIKDEKDIFRDFPSIKVQPKTIEQSSKKDDRVRMTCGGCGFNFKYNRVKNWPNRCPACSRSLRELKSYQVDLGLDMVN